MDLRKNGFDEGILFACAVARNCGDERTALQCVTEIGGLYQLKAAAKRTETEQDEETIEWLESLGAK